MMTVGSLVYHFFEHHLKAEKGLSQASIQSYRDGIRLFLLFLAKTTRVSVTKLTLADLTADHVRAFLTHLESERDNHIRSRNQRLAMIHTFFAFAVGREPTLLHEAERVAAIPRKRTQPPATRFLERDEVEDLFATLSNEGRLALRDRALLLFLYNTGARAAEVVGLTVGQLTLAPPPQVRLHGKGDKWRTCPLWPETARLIADMLQSRRPLMTPTSPAFVSRGWLGHVSLDTTNRYAEINIKMKQEALDACQSPSRSSVGPPRKPIWQSEPKLLEWLASL
jgi:integrase/recombinase XerD